MYDLLNEQDDICRCVKIKFFNAEIVRVPNECLYPKYCIQPGVTPTRQLPRFVGQMRGRKFLRTKCQVSPVSARRVSRADSHSSEYGLLDRRSHARKPGGADEAEGLQTVLKQSTHS
jgi:hypothetical protein